jgi:hypothetical protein
MNGYELYGLKMPVSDPLNGDGKTLGFLIKVPTLNPKLPAVELEVGLDTRASFGRWASMSLNYLSPRLTPSIPKTGLVQRSPPV